MQYFIYILFHYLEVFHKAFRVSLTFQALLAPLDFEPRIAEVTLKIPTGETLTGCTVQIDPDGKLIEITKRNNTVIIP